MTPMGLMPYGHMVYWCLPSECDVHVCRNPKIEFQFSPIIHTAGLCLKLSFHIVCMLDSMTAMKNFQMF